MHCTNSLGSGQLDTDVYKNSSIEELSIYLSASGHLVPVGLHGILSWKLDLDA